MINTLQILCVIMRMMTKDESRLSRRRKRNRSGRRIVVMGIIIGIGGEMVIDPGAEVLGGTAGIGDRIGIWRMLSLV